MWPCPAGRSDCAEIHGRGKKINETSNLVRKPARFEGAKTPSNRAKAAWRHGGAEIGQLPGKNRRMLAMSNATADDRAANILRS